MHRGRTRPIVALACAAAVTLFATGCREEPRDPIEVDEGALIVRNQTGRGWRDVRIVVNYWYNGSAREISAGSFVRAPLTAFEAAAGQKFNPAKTPLEIVVVTAVDDGGTAVKFSWDRKTQKQKTKR